jgi:hypothetical protein
MKEIEIVTTKKKLTKAFIDQMREITLDELDNASVLGFVNINPSILLLELGRFEYRKIYWHWYKSGKEYMYRKLGKWTVEEKFSSEENRDKYIAKLSEFKKEAVQIYI